MPEERVERVVAFRPKLVPTYNRRRKFWQLQWGEPTERGHRMQPPVDWGFRTKAEAIARRREIYRQRDKNRAGVLVMDDVAGFFAEISASFRKGHEFRCYADPMNGLVGLRDVTMGDSPLARVAVRVGVVPDLRQFWREAGRCTSRT